MNLNMQDDKKVLQFKKAVGNVIRNIRLSRTDMSLNKLALEYDFDKGNLSKTERGLYSIYLITAWQLSEALGLKFSEFAKLLEQELGEDFTLIDE